MGTYMGLAVPLYGESQITQQTAATDVLTITGAASQSGDFLVCENSTGAELFILYSSGAAYFDRGIQVATGSSFASTVNVTGVLTLSGISTTSVVAALNIAVSTTGAITSETGYLANAIQVTASSKSVLNNILLYESGKDADSCVAFLAVKGTKAPDYLLKVGNSTFGLGAAADNGFFNAAMTWTVFPTSAISIAGIKILAGTATYYVPAWPSTTFNA